jgi:hypothetical protein
LKYCNWKAFANPEPANVCIFPFQSSFRKEKKRKEKKRKEKKRRASKVSVSI